MELTFLLCVVGMCALIGALRAYRKLRLEVRSDWRQVVAGAVDGFLIGFAVAGILYCLWVVVKWWVGLVLIGWIFWPKRKEGQS